MLDNMFAALTGFISGAPRTVPEPDDDFHETALIPTALDLRGEGENQHGDGRSAQGGPQPGSAQQKPWSQAQERALYARPNSFTNLLPWREYDAVNKCFVLEDGTSVGAYFELQPIGCEARPDQWMRNLRDNLQNVLRAIPEVEEGYWTLQIYLNDEPSLDGLMDSIREYVHPRARDTAFTNDYLARMEEHLRTVTRPGGLFVDTTTSGAPWRGQIRRVRAVLYRRRGPGRQRPDMTPIMELNDAATRFENALASAGVGVKRCGGREFYRWMLAWFNPRTPIDDLLAMAPYPGDPRPGEEQPHGNDFAEMLLFNRPKSDKKTGLWWFDGLPHRTVGVQELRAIPNVGHITAERTMGDYSYALFDRVPEGATACMTITVRSREATLQKIDAIYRKSKGETADAELARLECEVAKRNIANGNVLYPVEMVWYLRGQDEKDLRHQVGLLKAILLTNNLQVIDELEDEISADTYIRNLPMKYDPALDTSAWTRRRRSRSWYIKHIANMLPLYGRSTGTGHPGVVAFSRSAEPLTFDMLNKSDRAKNAFMLMLGPPGSGKSATTIMMVMHYMAIYRPRLFIIEAGNSFGLFGDHCRKHGLTVNHVRLMPGVDVSLPPFSEALKLLDKGIPDPSVGLDDDDPETPADADVEVERRDYLGEMEIAARLMITGGEKKEDDRMTRADRMGIRRAIIEAARAVDEQGRKCVIVMDVVLAMRRVAEQEKGGRPERLREMADGMEMFCSGLAGEFFNRAGTRWPDADVTIVDMGILAREGYEDQLAVAVVGLMNAINNLAERDQHDERPTIVPIDEAHIITTNPLLAPFVVKMAKMWRKLGCWLWLITQNLADFPDASRKMLNMLEWWICLVMPKDEVEQIARFRSLTDEQRALLLAPRKEPGKYTEGVVMSDKVQALFRVVSTPLALALAQTEKHEKADRARLMAQFGCTELDAVYKIAERIGKSR
jgi:conjugative transfer ATPase